MAGTASLSVAFSGLFSDPSGAAFDANDLDLLGQSLTISGTKYQRGIQATSTSAAALELGSVTTPGWLVAINRGATAIHVRSGSGGANVITFPAGKGYAVYLATTTPFLVAASSTPVLDYLVIDQ